MFRSRHTKESILNAIRRDAKIYGPGLTKRQFKQKTGINDYRVIRHF
ncbi:MAG TPA: hypothetical protein VKJ65_14465 [Phycisphaerae bacterium]|nr:hypothetical protein [Phycisphaerae bacterium]